MGRHRSTLRDLGWGVSNSPNPWKQGSAKRVVRTLDYSQADMDEVPLEVAGESRNAGAAAPESTFDDRLHQLQQDGRQQLDRIREQFEAQDAENKRKLERLNGCALTLPWPAPARSARRPPRTSHRATCTSAALLARCPLL